MTALAIDARRLDLAAEFRADPFGRHSPEPQALLDVMRRAENCQDLILVSIAFVASRAHDNYRNNISRLVRNALDRFLDSKPFEMPANAIVPQTGTARG